MWWPGRPKSESYPQPSSKMLSGFWSPDSRVPPLAWLVLGASVYGVASVVRQRCRPVRDRLKSADYVTPDMYGHWLKGYVTAVGDSDGFRFCHTPGLFRDYYDLSSDARRQTMSIRLAGIDAPEGGHKHGGAKPQKYYAESLEWLIYKILAQTVYVKPLQKDMYGRIIAEVKRPWYNRESGEKSISEEMLSAGWAHVYVQSNAVYGDAGHNKTNKQNFLKLEAQAKAERKGMWKNPRERLEHPAEYKRRHAAAAAIQALGISASSPLTREQLVHPRTIRKVRWTELVSEKKTKTTTKTETRKRASENVPLVSMKEGRGNNLEERDGDSTIYFIPSINQQTTPRTII